MHECDDTCRDKADDVSDEWNNAHDAEHKTDKNAVR